MANYEEKFIVINKKHLAEISESSHLIGLVENLKQALDAIEFALPNNKYYVCNQDEPYAPHVYNTIIDGETAKGL